MTFTVSVIYRHTYKKLPPEIKNRNQRGVRDFQHEKYVERQWSIMVLKNSEELKKKYWDQQLVYLAEKVQRLQDHQHDNEIPKW